MNFPLFDLDEREVLVVKYILEQYKEYSPSTECDQSHMYVCVFVRQLGREGFVGANTLSNKLKGIFVSVRGKTKDLEEIVTGYPGDGNSRIGIRVRWLKRLLVHNGAELKG